MRSPLRMLGVSLVVAAMVAVGVGAWALAGGGERLGDVADDSRPRPAVPALPPTDLDSVASVDILGLRFDLPEGWVAAAPGSGASGEQLIRDDPAAAAEFDELLAAQSADTILFGIDVTGGGSFLTVSSPDVVALGGLQGLVNTGRLFLQGRHYTVTVDEPGELAGRDGHRFQFDFQDGAEHRYAVQFIVQVDEAAFTVTLFTTDPDRVAELVAVGATFRPS